MGAQVPFVSVSISAEESVSPSVSTYRLLPTATQVPDRHDTASSATVPLSQHSGRLPLVRSAGNQWWRRP